MTLVKLVCFIVDDLPFLMVKKQLAETENCNCTGQAECWRRSQASWIEKEGLVCQAVLEFIDCSIGVRAVDSQKSADQRLDVYIFERIENDLLFECWTLGKEHGFHWLQSRVESMSSFVWFARRVRCQVVAFSSHHDNWRFKKERSSFTDCLDTTWANTTYQYDR